MRDVACGAALERMPRAVLIGLIGQGVGPSLSPAMHQLEGARHGMHYVYRTIDITPDEATEAHLADLLRAARRLGFDGLNITHPLKQTIIPLLDELAPTAATVGAVNTVVFRDGRMIGHNTDVTGFGSAFDEAFGTDVQGAVPQGRVVLIGAGGAGAAVATALAARRIAQLAIVDVDPERAAALADVVASDAWSEVTSAAATELPALLAEAAGVVNATPFGMAAHPGTAFDVGLLEPGTWVADIVYRPAETELLAAARARGCRVMSGLGMAMGQAAAAFEIFTGEPADRRAMLSDLADLVAAESAATTTPAPKGRRGEDATPLPHMRGTNR